MEAAGGASENTTCDVAAALPGARTFNKALRNDPQLAERGQRPRLGKEAPLMGSLFLRAGPVSPGPRPTGAGAHFLSFCVTSCRASLIRPSRASSQAYFLWTATTLYKAPCHSDARQPPDAQQVASMSDGRRAGATDGPPDAHPASCAIGHPVQNRMCPHSCSSVAGS
ncbi:hypothetical protein SKAU_G00106790 [Synaphobranchus kaupii]|uniref:Uncharacterized protein n=1 Tax=Synaphobranchus kaupii TaxID=118154 RepID=A0A9Q1J7Z2_SYNKA|nr:hypothetical protein SKAU_G00106790 [Synaphobranchus kaupii]